MSTAKFNSDEIDDYFFKVFKPMYMITSVLGSTRISYKNKLVSSTSSKQKVYACAVTSMAVYAFYYVSFNIDTSLNRTNKKQTLPNTIQFINFVFLYGTIMVTNCFAYPKLNAQIFVVLQNVDRTLKIIGKDEQYNYIYTRNIVNCCLLFFYYMFWSVLFSITLLDNFTHYLLTSFAFMAFSVEDFELFNYSTFFAILRQRIEYINVVMEGRAAVNWPVLIKDAKGRDVDRLAWHRISEAYYDISKAFGILQRIYEPYAFSASAFALMSMLTVMQRMIAVDFKINGSQIFLLIFTCVKTCSRPCVMVVANELLSMKLKRTRNNCLLLLNKHNEGPVRKIVKNIMRTSKVCMRPFSVYGVFVMNARLPLRLLALTTTYTVVLLQFAFL